MLDIYRWTVVLVSMGIVGMCGAVAKHAQHFSPYPKTLRTMLAGVSLVMFYLALLHWEHVAEVDMGVAEVGLVFGLCAIVGSLFVLNYEWYTQETEADD
jgi:uncharacterized membrane protein YgdD (TMEM256/DUF423 family)